MKRFLSRIGVVGLMVVFAVISFSFSIQAAEKKKLTVNGKFGQIVSKTTSSPGDVSGHEIDQQVRIDMITSSDSDWNGATLTVYEHLDSFAEGGSYKLYGVFRHKDGDTSYVKYEGTWKVITQDGKFVEATGEGKGQFIGGTGKFKNITGDLLQRTKVTPSEGAVYTIQAEVSY